MQPDLRVALAHDHLFQYGGAEQVLQQCIRLFPDAPVYTLIARKGAVPLPDSANIKTSFLQHMPGGTSFFKWYLPQMPTAWERFDFSAYDLVVSSCSGFVKGLITPESTTHICYCHSPARYLWHDTFDYVASLRLPNPARLYLSHLLDHLREWDQIAASRVDYFIANSNYIASRIRKYYDRESVVVYPPVVTSQFSVSTTQGSYYLIVSRLRPYKRVDLAIQAFNAMRLPLVVVGTGEEYRRLKSQARSNIYFLGEVSDARRNKLLSECRAFIHPQEEDFGISAVEAMASGRPVIAYRGGGALETVREGVSGTFFNEQSWESLAYAVLKHEYDQYDPQRIREQALRFDVSVFRDKMRDYIHSVLQR